MGYTRTAREVFDDWARDYHADGMEQHHRAPVLQALERVPASSGACLEIGIGNGYAIRHLATNAFAGGACHGLDLSEPMAEKARERVADLPNVRIDSGDFLDPRFAPSTRYALIFSMEVFYYFPEIQHGLDKAAGLLEPNGMLIVLVNYYHEHRASHAWPEQLDTPMQLWSGEDYRNGFRQAGLREIGQQRLTSEESDNPGTLATWGLR